MYVGTTIALTVFVFAVWYLYIWLSTRKKPLLQEVDTEKGRLQLKSKGTMGVII
jgi:hypothetical protein